MQPLRPQAAQPSLGALGSAAFQALAAADIAPEADFFQKYQACSLLCPVTMSPYYHYDICCKWRLESYTTWSKTRCSLPRSEALPRQT